MMALLARGAACLVLALPLAAQAQTATTTTTTSTVTVSVTQQPPPLVVVAQPGAYSKLSPGQQSLAQALFNAQVAKPDGPAPLSLDQIATLRRGSGGTEGWGQVFKDMHTAGLVPERNLGQVVSSYRHQQHQATTPLAATGAVTMVTAGGRTVTTGGGRGKGSGNESVASNAGAATTASSAAAAHGGAGGAGGNHGKAIGLGK